MGRMTRLFKRNKLYRYLIITVVLTATAAIVYAASWTYPDFEEGQVASSSVFNDKFNFLLDRSWDLSGSDLYYDSGNVGIGTTNPSTKLEIASVNGLVGNIGFGDIARDMWFDGGSDGNFPFVNTGASIGSTSFAWDDGTGSLKEYLTIKNDGNVGIGNTAPASTMDITVPSSGTSNNGLFVRRNSSSYGPRLDLINETEEGHHWAILSAGTGNWAGTTGPFEISDLTAGKARMIIDTNGNVGIGTTSPNGKLDVNGSIYQSGSVLHADYVFEPDFKLESIEEHADFMWKEKHLKSVPKARKDKNGQDIIEYGSHMRGMLEELEKAHVYIATLNGLIKEQQKTITLLLEKVENLENQSK